MRAVFAVRRGATVTVAYRSVPSGAIRSIALDALDAEDAERAVLAINTALAIREQEEPPAEAGGEKGMTP